MSLLELFCAVDDFCQGMGEQQVGRLLPGSAQQRRRAGQLSDSEALTIMIHFHQSQYRNFKAYYQQHVQALGFEVMFKFGCAYAVHVARIPLVDKGRNQIHTAMDENAELAIQYQLGTETYLSDSHVAS